MAFGDSQLAGAADSAKICSDGTKWSASTLSPMHWPLQNSNFLSIPNFGHISGPNCKEIRSIFLKRNQTLRNAAWTHSIFLRIIVARAKPSRLLGFPSNAHCDAWGYPKLGAITIVNGKKYLSPKLHQVSIKCNYLLAWITDQFLKILMQMVMYPNLPRISQWVCSLNYSWS